LKDTQLKGKLVIRGEVVRRGRGIMSPAKSEGGEPRVLACNTHSKGRKFWRQSTVFLEEGWSSRPSAKKGYSGGKTEQGGRLKSMREKRLKENVVVEKKTYQDLTADAQAVGK